MNCKLKTISLSLTSLLILSFFSCQTNRDNRNIKPVKIIFDTDMGPDYDDAGAIAALHALADSGDCEILATVSSNSHPSIAPTIETFNRYFQRPDIPIGVTRKRSISINQKNNWNDSIIIKFAPEIKDSKNYPSATETYRKVLSSQPDQSVTIVTVGFTTNLENLLKSHADEFSSLPGTELVKKKVKNWVAMAGRFPEGREFNVYRDAEASYFVFNHWPTRILFSGWEIGNSILTGSKLAKMSSPDNPVVWAYQYNLNTYANKPVENRMSWDQTAVLCAIRDPERYFYVCGPGKFTVTKDGFNEWDPDINGNHYFLVHKYPYKKIADIIEKLMMHQPKRNY